MNQALQQALPQTLPQAPLPNGSPTGMALLEAGIPLSLLVDLMTLDVSRSREIARSERADTGWIHAAA